MSSPEVERFEVTEEDLQNEFNPNRKRFKLSKEQAIYGMWADDSDDERPAFGKKQKDYTAPVSFVTGGIKVGDKVTKAEEDEEQEEEESDEERKPTMLASTGRSRPKGSAFKKSGKGGRFAGENQVGGWERHTKGIGAKLMEKMGYQKGHGLGKNLQGISTPVEAVQRKGRAAVGYYGTERSERSLIDYPTKPDSDEEADQEFKANLTQWKKPESAQQKKQKFIYKTADDLIASGGKKKPVIPQSELSKVKVIDMTGKEKRVLSGYHAISLRHDRPEIDDDTGDRDSSAFDMPELLHNLDLLIDMTEDEILQNNKKLQHEKDMLVNLEHESKKLKEECDKEGKMVERLKELLALVCECEKRMEPGCPDPITLDDCVDVFGKIQQDYYVEYKSYGLASLMVALVFPLMKKKFANWQVLRDRSFGYDTVKQWKDILEDPTKKSNNGSGFMDPYEKLIWDIWMPHVRQMMLLWTPRNPEPLIELIETWLPLLPEWITCNIMEQLVLPRLQKEVDEWNPLTDTMPIHSWIHPWLPLMGDRLETLYAPIRHKLANALNNWHPSDPSAFMILKPWKDVFQKGHMEAFLVKHIATKLALCLQEFVINPHQQVLEPWNWTMQWQELMPLPAYVSLLENNFFPKWHQVLCTWLSNNPNYEEVTKWYSGWKSMMPEVLLAHPIIKEEFNKALMTMNRAVSSQQRHIPGARENMAYFTSQERMYSPRPPPPPPPPAPVSMQSQAQHNAAVAARAAAFSFKDLVEQKAEENGLLFMPVPNRTWEAKQVYRFGRVFVYLDRGVIFLQDPQTMQWMPVSLQTLVDRAR